MRVLVACEFSGVVREAFRKRGHDAISVDLLPSELPGPHIQGDMYELLTGKEFQRLGTYSQLPRQWYSGDGKLLIDILLAFYSCRYLCNSGIKHLYNGGKKINGRDEARWDEMQKAAGFFRFLLEQPFRKICVENPRQHPYAQAIIRQKHSQVLQPWMFGHPETKATCIWLKGLPELAPTNDVREEMRTLPKAKAHRVHYASPGADRWKERSRTMPGIADAMADQWGSL